MQLEAVVLAAGAGSRMVELTRGRPKCLLPVGGQSLIWFSITNLRSIGVTRIIILIPDIYESDIKQYCHKKFNSFKDLTLDFVTVPIEADCGSAESILSIKEKIRSDFIVYSCDAIVEPKALSFLVNHYRLYDPMLSMLLSDDINYFQPKSVPGRQDKENLMRDVIAFEALDKLDLTANDVYSANKVVFLHSERDLKQKLKIKNRELALHPSLEVCSRFLDTHIYIFKRQMLDFMERNTDKAVLKGEMIPSLISSQFNKLKIRKEREEDDDDDDIVAITKQSNYEVELKEKLESFDPRNVTQTPYLDRKSPSKPPSCHAIIVKNLLAYRVNTLGSYLDSNRKSKNILNSFGLKNRLTIKDCSVGENTTVGAKSLIKGGSIGNNCKIGDKVKLIDCVLMDNVEIESNVSLSNCIVATDSKIGSESDLKLCIIGYRQIVPKKKANSEVIDGHMIDLSDPTNND